MNNSKSKIIKAAALIGGVAVLAIIAKLLVKKAIEKKEKARLNAIAIELGETQTAQQTTESAAAQSYNPTQHIEQLDEWILGGNFMYYPKEIITLFNSLTDAKLRKLATAWNEKFGRTLHYDLDDELDACGFFFSDCYIPHKARLESIGMI